MEKQTGSERLLNEIDLLKNGVADDLEMIREGKEGIGGKNLKYISFDKKDDKFNRVKVLMETIRLFDEPNKAGRPRKSESENNEETELEIKENPKETGNVFELTSKRLIERKLNGNR